MAHTQERSSWVREGQIAVVGGALYGFSHTVSGHPLDNIKARMQLDPTMRSLSGPAVALRMWRTEGLRAFWRGVIPPLWGSSVYRSAMMSSYEACYTYLESVDPQSDVGRVMHAEWFAVRPLVVVSAVACSVFRSLFESPIEYAKVMRQTGRQWLFSDIYRGALTQVARTTAMLLFIFVPYDIIRKKTTWFQGSLAAQWALTTLVCGTSYAISWPLETLKNLAQAGTPRPGASLTERLTYVGGIRGLYTGSTPGIVCGGFRNGIAFLTMAKFHEIASRCGLRD